MPSVRFSPPITDETANEEQTTENLNDLLDNEDLQKSSTILSSSTTKPTIKTVEEIKNKYVIKKEGFNNLNEQFKKQQAMAGNFAKAQISDAGKDIMNKNLNDSGPRKTTEVIDNLLSPAI